MMWGVVGFVGVEGWGGGWERDRAVECKGMEWNGMEGDEKRVD